MYGIKYFLFSHNAILLCLKLFFGLIIVDICFKSMLGPALWELIILPILIWVSNFKAIEAGRLGLTSRDLSEITYQSCFICYKVIVIYNYFLLFALIFIFIFGRNLLHSLFPAVHILTYYVLFVTSFLQLLYLCFYFYVYLIGLSWDNLFFAAYIICFYPFLSSNTLFCS